jgi:hypothetical protein
VCVASCVTGGAWTLRRRPSPSSSRAGCSRLEDIGGAPIQSGAKSFGKASSSTQVEYRLDKDCGAAPAEPCNRAQIWAARRRLAISISASAHHDSQMAEFAHTSCRRIHFKETYARPAYLFCFSNLKRASKWAGGAGAGACELAR